MSLLRNRWLAIAAIVAVGLAAYATCYRGAFVLDDLTSIGDNPTIRHLTDWPAVLTPLRGLGRTVEGRPLVNLSLAINYALGRTSVTGYHVVNVGIHLLAGLTLFGLLRRLTGSVGAALAAALLWTVHPLNTSAVTYVVQRAESLMGLFYLLTLYCFGWSALSERAWQTGDFTAAKRARRSRSTLGLLLSVVCCWLGMATKEVMVSAPLAVLLLDRLAVAGSFAAAWRARRGYYLALASSWVLLAGLVWHTGSRGQTSGFGSGIRAAHYWLTQPGAVLRYLKLAVWPAPLVFDSGTEWVVQPVTLIVALLVIGGLVIGTIQGLVKNRPWGVLGFVFFATLAPTSLIPGNRQTAADHRMYLALAAVVTAVVLWGWQRWLLRRGQGSAQARSENALHLVVGLIAGGFVVLTYRRNEEFRSPLILYGADVAHAPENAYAQTNYATALLMAKDYAAAVPHFETALRLKSDIQETEDNLGNALFALGQDDAAKGHYRHVIATRPDFADPYNNLAAVELKQGHVVEARQALETAVRLRPDFAEAHAHLGVVLLQQQQIPPALAELKKATALQPENAENWMDLGNALRAARQPEAARDALNRAQRLEPANPAVYYNAAGPEIDLRHYDQAVALLRQALQLDPTNPDAHENLGSALYRQNDLKAAVAEYQIAVRLAPNNAVFHYNLGNGLLGLRRRDEAAAELQAALRLNPGLQPARTLLHPLNRSSASRTRAAACRPGWP